MDGRLSSWVDELTGSIYEQCEALSSGMDEPPPLILGGEGLVLAPIREPLAMALGAQVVLPWYSTGVGIGAGMPRFYQRQLQTQAGGAA